MRNPEFLAPVPSQIDPCGHGETCSKKKHLAIQNCCMYTVTERTQFTATAAWFYLQLSVKGDLPSVCLVKVAKCSS
ncbi:hypothetical protein Y1Q_0020852 [Alligator mississippiensis]|uniref:Uncharacterized protein n=1 Tax=Alligator mississippiensis TaxID=8496 RepID=A0A151NJ40_ALLMI|nr:hypothetical protein Y1Q_0020852 [Alligator mississippiensis]